MTPAGLARLKLDEGLRLDAYPDPKTGGNPWTIGYGHTGKNVHQGMSITEAQADWLLKLDVASAEHMLGIALPWLANYDPVRADVLTNVAFNVGAAKLLTWVNTLAAFRDRRWADAAHALRNEGQWNRDVGKRAERLAVATETGSWDPPSPAAPAARAA